MIGRLDKVDAAERAERAEGARGARRLPAARERGFRVVADPAGNPCCLVFG